MAKDELQVLLQLGPFIGLDTADGEPYVPPGYAISAKNVNTYRRKGSLMPERGRVTLQDFGNYLARINTLAYITTNPPYVESSATPDYDQLLIQGVDAGGHTVTILFDITSGRIDTVKNALQFTQAVQYGQVVYTNGGQRLFAASSDPNYPKLYTWQYTGFAPTVTLTTSTVGGHIPQETRFYVYTQQTVMPDGTVSETSPENYPTPQAVTTGAGTTNSNTLTPGPLQFTGFNSDGTTYTTNIYAQSSLQAGYFLVGNANTNTPFVDTLSDADLATKTPLLVVGNSAFQRDPPPTGRFGVGGGRYINNFAYLRVHKNCMFVFSHVDSAIVAGTPPQCQLWPSKPGRPWEFGDTDVLLLQDSVESSYINNIEELSTDYNSPRGDYAKALAPAGSYLLCAKKRELWLVYGDGTDQAPFVQQRILDFGAQSIRAVTPCVGGCFIKTENGIYFFDGNSPQYEEPKFRTVNTDKIAKTLLDDIHTVGAFSNMTYYLFYPTLNKGYAYNTVLGDWITELDYAPPSEDAIFSTPADASDTTNSNINRVVSVRGGLPTAVDFLFADDRYDLGNPSLFSWQGPETDTPGDEYKKEYSALTVYAPKQKGLITVTLTVDQDPTTAYVKTFDLSAQRPLQANFSLQGYSANLGITVQGIKGQPAPEIWKVQVWGINPPMRKLTVPN